MVGDLLQALLRDVATADDVLQERHDLVRLRRPAEADEEDRIDQILGSRRLHWKVASPEVTCGGRKYPASHAQSLFPPAPFSIRMVTAFSAQRERSTRTVCHFPGEWIT